MIDVASLDDSALLVAQTLLVMVSLLGIALLITGIALLGSEVQHRRWIGLGALVLAAAAILSLPSWGEAAKLERAQHQQAVAQAVHVMHDSVGQLRKVESIEPAAGRWTDTRLLALAAGQPIDVQVSSPERLGTWSAVLALDPDTGQWSLDEGG